MWWAKDCFGYVWISLFKGRTPKPFMFKGRTPKPFMATQIILGTWRSFGDVWITLGLHLGDIDYTWMALI